MEINAQIIGLRIKNRRKELHLTQTDIKAAVGISSGNMSEIENGNRLPAAVTLIQLADILKCSIDWILTGASSIASPSISSNEDPRDIELLNGFWSLPEDEKEELMGILRMKLHKIQKARKVNPRSYELTDNNSMIG